MQYDVLNVDADGIAALVQLRKAYPLESQLITGVKRDIQLLEQLNAHNGDQVVVLDISFDKNRQAVLRLLAAGADILYMDHHRVGEEIQHPKLLLRIDVSANQCTGLLMDAYLSHVYTDWAIVGAYGDNLTMRKPINYAISLR